MTDLFDTAEMVLGYANSRPAVHEQILSRMTRHFATRFARALDVGCGCGLSTRALDVLVEEVFGVEPVAAMLRLAPTVAPGAKFVAGIAEKLPFRSGSVDLITGAGSLNYVELDLFLAEAARVLSDNGVLAVYDFGQGNRSSTAFALAEWFQRYNQMFPAPQQDGRFLDPVTLRESTHGYRVLAQESFVVEALMTRRSYIEYILTETNVASAVRNGARLSAIRSWCEDTIAIAWPGSDEVSQEILFPSYFVCMTPLNSDSRG